MSRPSPFARAMAWTGALVFVAALAAGVATYLVAFSTVPGAWSPETGLWPVTADVLLFSAFALHHSAFARLGLKQHVARFVGEPLERSTYVWVASLLFLAVLWLWVPVPGVLWHVTSPAALALHAVQIAGVALTAHASGRLGVMALAGIPQAEGRALAAPSALRTEGVYGLVRHPIYLAWLLMVWPTPMMTGSRLTFAIVSTMYLVLAVPIEERSLVREFGPAYRDYQRTVRWRMMPFLY